VVYYCQPVCGPSGCVPGGPSYGPPITPPGGGEKLPPKKGDGDLFPPKY
jgi:hypothetical protein